MRPPPRPMIEIVLLLLAVAAADPSRAEAPDPRRDGSFEFRPGVIVDEARSLCYLMSVEGGVEALDLLSGKILWTTAAAQKPLLLLDSTLVAQAGPQGPGNLLRLVLLDPTKSGAVKRRVDAKLPEGVRAGIDEGSGSSFSTVAWAASGVLTVSWTYSRAQISGAEDTTRGGGAGQGLAGAVRVNLNTGEVSLEGSGRSPPSTSSPLPTALSRLEERGRLPHPLWRTDNVYAAVSRVRKDDGSERTVLKRWHAATGDSLPDVALFAGGYTVRYPSADGKNLLASRLAAASPPYDRYDWAVFSLASGARIAELQLNVPGAWFFVTGPLLVYETQPRARVVDGTWMREPRQLHGVDLKTGRERWTRPFRDIAYRGALPPDTPTPDDSEEPSKSPGSQQQ
jgi:hypothetical protein